jgi:hypothetical protein
MISKEEYTRIMSNLLMLYKECEILHNILVKERRYYKDEILSGDYSDDAIEAIIRGTFNDYEVHILSLCIRIMRIHMFSNINWEDITQEENKYCFMVDYIKNGILIFDIQMFEWGYTFDKMEEKVLFLKNDGTIYNYKKYEILLFMDKILKLNENKKFI